MNAKTELVTSDLVTESVDNIPSKATQCRTSREEKRELSPKQARQRAFLEAYKANTFNVTQACKVAGIGRRTFYDWKKLDPGFCVDLEISQDELKDYLKSQLLKLVDEGNLIATIFACKSLAGLVESTKQDITISKGPSFDQAQLDGLVRGQFDRTKYENMLGL